MSAKRYVEVMVVADYKMKEYYRDKLQEYVLTLMAIVSIFIMVSNDTLSSATDAYAYEDM